MLHFMKPLQVSQLWKTLNKGYHIGPRLMHHRSGDYLAPFLIPTRSPPNLHCFSNKVNSQEHNETIGKIENQKIVVTEAPSRRERLQKAVKEYGTTVIVFHVGISLMSLGTCYILVSAGMDSSQVFSFLGLKEWAENSQLAANAGTFAVAYAIHKVFAPVRITITLGSVPFIVRYLRKVGFLKATKH